MSAYLIVSLIRQSTRFQGKVPWGFVCPLRRPPQIRLQLRRHASPHQRTLDLPTGGGVQVQQEAGLSPFEHGDGLTVAEEETVSREGGDAVAGRRDAHQIQRVRGGDG